MPAFGSPSDIGIGIDISVGLLRLPLAYFCPTLLTSQRGPFSGHNLPD